MGGFPQSRNFYVSTHVNFARVNKIEAMYRRSRVNIKVGPRSTCVYAVLTYTLPLFYLRA